jgi:hypothetical protein
MLVLINVKNEKYANFFDEKLNYFVMSRIGLFLVIIKTKKIFQIFLYTKVQDC